MKFCQNYKKRPLKFPHTLVCCSIICERKIKKSIHIRRLLNILHINKTKRNKKLAKLERKKSVIRINEKYGGFILSSLKNEDKLPFPWICKST